MIGEMAIDGREASPGDAKGLIVAGTASRTGKTTVTLAALRAMRRRGLSVSSGKVGPDYIDPEFHRAATGGFCTNLDPYAMGTGTLRRLMSHLAKSEYVLIEGAMGLFDGSAGGGGSTADLAAHLGLPVVLVVDVSGQSASVSAVVQGFRNFRPDVKVEAVILNQVGSARHEKMCRRALDGIGCPVISALPRNPDLVKEHRYLGLKQAEEIPDLEELLERAADWFEGHTDWDLFSSLFESVHAEEKVDEKVDAEWGIPPLGAHVAVASDVAFRFFYPHLALAWEDRGARVSFFSPLADEAPHPAADAIFLPGGYPELHAGEIGGNGNFLNSLRQAARKSIPIYGECGGYMVLGESLRDRAGVVHPMAGLLPIQTTIAPPRRHLGYRELLLQQEIFGDKACARLRAHEFHYASIEEAQPYSGSLQPLFEATDSEGEKLGPAGHVKGPVAGSFIHLIDRADE
jgi:cobyrinic acid a,c-diamide synthase